MEAPDVDMDFNVAEGGDTYEGDKERTNGKWSSRSVLTVVAIIIVVVLIIIGVWWLLRVPVPRYTDPPRWDPPPKPINGSFFTDSASCNKSPTRTWMNTTESNIPRCECVYPFYGPLCDQELVSDRYSAIGFVDGSNIAASDIRTAPASRLSFPFQGSKETCTGLCDADESCSGVIWDTSKGIGVGDGQPTCTLLMGDIGLGDPSLVSRTEKANLYLKKGRSLSVVGRAYVYSGNLRQDWMTCGDYHDGGHLQVLRDGHTARLSFRPENVIVGDGCVVLSRDGSKSGSETRTVSSSGLVSIPQDWDSVYATFMSSGIPSKRTIEWSGRQDVTVSSGESIRFVSRDGRMHNMFEADDAWNAISRIEPDSNSLDTVLAFSETTNLMCTLDPKTRIRVVVPASETMKASSDTSSPKLIPIEWNLNRKGGWGNKNTGIQISAQRHDTLVFSSSDGMFHGLESEVTPNGKKISLPVSNTFNGEVPLDGLGKYIFHCRVYPTRMRLTVLVS